MFGLMLVSTHKRILAAERAENRKLNIDAWGVVVRMTGEIRGAQKGLIRAQRKLKRCKEVLSFRLPEEAKAIFGSTAKATP